MSNNDLEATICRDDQSMKQFKPGDIAWIKNRNSCWWPGQVYCIVKILIAVIHIVVADELFFHFFFLFQSSYYKSPIYWLSPEWSFFRLWKEGLSFSSFLTKNQGTFLILCWCHGFFLTVTRIVSILRLCNVSGTYTHLRTLFQVVYTTFGGYSIIFTKMPCFFLYKSYS